MLSLRQSVNRQTDAAEVYAQSRWKDPPYPRSVGPQPHVCSGPHVTYEKKIPSFFNVFKVFVKIFVHNEI